MSMSSVNNSSYISSIVQDIKAGKALDYAKVKSDYQKNNPNGDFIRDIGTEILKIRMNGGEDTALNEKTVSQLQRLASSSNEPNQVSFPVLKKGNFGDPPSYVKQTEGTLSGEFQLNINSPDGKNIDSFVGNKITSLEGKPITDISYDKKSNSYSLTLNADSIFGSIANPTINLKSDKNGQLFYDTDFIFTGKVKSGLEEGLKNAGINATLEEKDGKTYLVPKDVTVKGVNIDAKNLKFEINEQGIKIKADKADFKGDASVLSETGLVPQDALPLNSKADISLKGNASFSEKDTKLNIDQASADLKIQNNGTNEDVKNFVKSIQAQAQSGSSLSKEISENLAKSGIPKEIVETLLTADDKKITALLEDPVLTEKLKQSSLYLRVDAKNIAVTSSDKGVSVDGKNSSISASSGLEKKEDLTFEKVQKLRADLKNNPKILEELTRKGLNSSILDSLKTTEDLNKLPKDQKDKLRDVAGAIYNREELLSANLKADTIHGNIGENTAVSATGTITHASVTNGFGKISLSAQANSINIDQNAKDGKVANAVGATLGVKAENIKLTKEDLQALSDKVEQISQKIEDEVKKIGLTKEQFLGIANAVTNISNAKGSVKNQISSIAKNFNAKENQINDFMNLFSSKEFNGLLNNSKEILDQIKEAKNGQFNFSTELKADTLSMLNNAKGLVTTATNASTAINASTSDGKVQASATLGATTTTISNGTVTSNDITAKLDANSGKENVVSAKGTLSTFDLSRKDSGISATLGNIQGNFTDGAFNTTGNIGQFIFDQNIGLKVNDTKLVADYKKNNHLELNAGTISSTNSGVSIDKLHSNISASRKEKTASGNISVNADIDKITTKVEKGNKQPTTILNGTKVDINGDIKTAIGSINDAKFRFSSKELSIKPSGSVTGDPKITGANANVNMTYAQLKNFIQNNPSGKAVLNSIKESGINIPDNQNLNLKITKGSIQSGVFSGNLTLPSFDTGLGKASVSIKVDSGNLTTQKVNLGGVVNLKMDTEKVFSALRTSLKLDDNIKLTKDENNQIKANLEGFLKSGEASIAVDKNDVKIHIDKAQFIKLFPVKGFARENVEKLLKESSIEFTSSGNNITIPIKELTDFIGANDLTISNVSSDKNGNYQIPFRYKN